MIIKLDESKIMEFNMDLMGASPDNIEAKLRFIIDGIEYGFPAKITENTISVEIPALKNIINTKVINESVKKIQGRLDVIANGNVYISPWNSEIIIESPVSLKVENKDKDIRDFIEKTRDIKIGDPKITTISTAEKNPEPFNKVLMNAKKEADRKAKEFAEQEKKKEKTKLGSALLGDK